MGKANLGNKLDVARTDECSFSPSMALSPCHSLAYAASVQFEVFTDKEKKMEFLIRRQPKEKSGQKEISL